MRLPLLLAILYLGVAHISCNPVVTITADDDALSSRETTPEIIKEGEKQEATQGVFKTDDPAAPTQADQSVSEEPKADDLKAEEPKVEEPKVEEPKAEEAKAQEAKAVEQQPKAAEQPKATEESAKETTKVAKDKVTGRQSDADDDDDDDDLDLDLDDDDDSDDDDDYLGGIFDDILGGMWWCGIFK